jgi:Arc/MetJ-type ribon-helix-helix transcriptional regulator
MYYMRSILNISLPESTVKEIKREVKLGGYASVSEYFRQLIRERQEARLVRELERERAEGLFKLNSLRELMD